MPAGFGFSNLINLLTNLRNLWLALIKKTTNYIGIRSSDDDDDDDDELHGEVIYNNMDVMIIAFIGFLLVTFGILGGVAFYFLFQPKVDVVLGKAWLDVVLIFILVFFIMVSLSGWALVPSLLSSRFPERFRATASSLAYNGGLCIGFASPFIMLENFLNFKSEWVIFVPVILGAVAMIIGATRFINFRNDKYTQDAKAGEK
jgi:hypothetical protein